MAAVFVEDRIVVPPGRREEVRSLFEKRYREGAAQRGLTLVGSWATPPAELAEHDSELVLLWSLPDLAAFWRMRALNSADGGLEAFWRDVDAVALRRERRFLAPLALA